MRCNSNNCLASELLDLKIVACRLANVIFRVNEYCFPRFQPLPNRFNAPIINAPIMLGGGGGGSKRHFTVKFMATA